MTATKRTSSTGALPVDATESTVERHLTRILACGPRFCGTDGETRCRDLLEREFREIGLFGVHLEEFPYLGYSHQQSNCSIVGSEPFECMPLQSTASVRAQGRAIYVGDGCAEDVARTEAALGSLAGRVVVATSRDLFSCAPSFATKNIAAFVHIETTSGGLIGGYTAVLEPTSLAPPWNDKILPFPGVTVSAASGRRLLAELSLRPTVIEVEHRAAYAESVGWNIVARVERREMADESVVYVGAHYDSAYSSPGAWDNGTGLATLLTTAATMSDLKQRRETIFIAFGSEEPGLWGSLNYVDRHRADLAHAAAMVNLDTIGSPFQSAPKVLAASSAMAAFAERRLALAGWTADRVVAIEDEPQFDYAAFHRAGVPVAGLLQSSPGHPFYHSAGDVLGYVNLRSTATAAGAVGGLVAALATCGTEDLPGRNQEVAS